MFFPRTLLIIIWSLSIIIGVYSFNIQGEDYFNDVVLGEYATDNFFLPYEPLIDVDKNTRRIFYRQNIVAQDAVNFAYPEHLNQLEFAFFPELLDANRCPNYVMSRHVEYLRYVFRLLSVSYLFETLKEYNDMLKNFGDRQSCSTKWEDLFDQCQPQSAEMKKFLKRLRPSYVEAFNKNEVNLIKDPSIERWRTHWCQNEKKCENQDAGKKICQDSRKLIVQICSENDSLYGLSYIPEMARILKTSNVMNILNQEGYGIGCLDRFVTLFRDIESKYYWLKPILPVIFRKNIAGQSKYLEGELFLRGALREYDEKGLGDFLFAVKPVKESSKELPEVVSIIKLMEEPTPTPLPSVSVKSEEKPARDTVAFAPVVVVKLSEFESKIQLREQRSLSILGIDMNIFEKDYPFTEDTIKKYDKNLKNYYSRSALMDMLSLDQLGSKQEPVRLKFLKYLMDTDKHQGLFNLQAVIGEKFYVLNDFENKAKPQYIKLENSEKTNFRWQIYILED